MSVRRCHATILFADISSATRLGEIIDPEIVAEILNKVRSIAEQVISKYDGVVNQFYGDGVLAAFGFPSPREDDVFRATLSALELHQQVRSIPQHQLMPSSFSLRLHSGIHAGLVVVEKGDSMQGRYKLVGDALNTAARLSDKADVDEIVVSANTLQGVHPFFVTEELPPLNLKGKEQPIAAYRVLRRSNIKTRYEARVQLGLTKYIGRSAELRLLDETWRKAKESGFQLINILGDAGLGKTRLAEEFLSSVIADSSTIYRTYCQNKGRPLQPFVQLLQQIFGIQQDMPPNQATEKIERFLSVTTAKLLDNTQILLRVLSLLTQPSKETPSTSLGFSLVKEIVNFLSYIASQKPLIVFIDDWHCADELSKLMLMELERAAKKSPIYCIIASRPILTNNFLLNGTVLNLEPFSLSESTQVINALFCHELELRIAASIHQRSGGNALFIEELCKTLIQNQRLKDAGRDSDKIPPNLQGLIAMRVDLLPQEYHELIRMAAIIGNIVDIGLFEQLLGYPLTKEQITKLAEYDLIYKGDGQRSLRFKHGLTRDVVYESVNLKERQHIHLRVAEILEERTKMRCTDDDYEALAYHYTAGRNNLAAGRYAELAGDKALATSALDRARQQYRTALNNLDPSIWSNSSYEQWNTIIQRLGWTCVFDPSPDQLDLLQRALTLAREHDDRKGIAKAEYWLGYVNYALGDAKQAIPHCENVIATAQKLGNEELAAHARATLGQACASACNYPRALSLFKELPTIEQRYKSKGPSTIGSAYARACKAAVLGDQGLFDQAYECFGQAMGAVAGIDHEVGGSILALYAAVKLWQGQWSDALKLAAKAKSKAQHITSSYVFAMGSALYSYAAWKLHGDEKFLQTIIESTQWLESQGKHLFISLNYGWIVDAMASQNKTQIARNYAARALSRARKGDRLGEAITYRGLAQLAFREQSFKHVNRYLDLAMASAAARNSDHEKAVTLLHKAKIAEHINQYETAKQDLDSAYHLFLTLKMDWHIQQAEQLAQNF